MICLYYRWRISLVLDRDDGAAQLPERHLRRCPSCRRFHERSLGMAAALRDAPAEEGTAVRLTLPAVAGHARWKRAAGLAAAACIALGVILAGKLRPDHGARVTAGTGDPGLTRPVVFSTDTFLAQVRRPLESVAYPAGRGIARQIEQTQNEVLAAGRSMISCLPTGLPG